MKIIQNYKLWLIVSVTFLLMFVAVCIFSAKNFYELDAYRAEKSENINRKAIITRLTNENAELKSEKLAVQSSENLESIVMDFIETHYRSNDEIKQEVLIKSVVWQIKDDYQATAFADLEITFTYPDRTKDKNSVILQFEFQYDKSSEIWKMSDVKSSNVKWK